MSRTVVVAVGIAGLVFASCTSTLDCDAIRFDDSGRGTLPEGAAGTKSEAGTPAGEAGIAGEGGRSDGGGREEPQAWPAREEREGLLLVLEGRVALAGNRFPVIHASRFRPIHRWQACHSRPCSRTRLDTLTSTWT